MAANERERERGERDFGCQPTPFPSPPPDLTKVIETSGRSRCYPLFFLLFSNTCTYYLPASTREKDNVGFWPVYGIMLASIEAKEKTAAAAAADKARQPERNLPVGGAQSSDLPKW